MQEIDIDILDKIIPQEARFDPKTERFLQDGTLYVNEHSDETFSIEGMTLEAMPVVGNAQTYLFTDKNDQKWVIKISLPDIQRFFQLPSTVRDHHRINPIAKVSLKHRFCSTPLIDGFEGEVIQENLEPIVYAKEWIDLVVETAKIGVAFDDVEPVSGHNVFWDIEKKELVLFDHGSFRYDPKMDYEKHLMSYIRERFTRLHNIFHVIGYDHNLNMQSNGEIELSQAFIQRLETEFYLISGLIISLDLDYFPATKRIVKSSEIEDDIKQIPSTFKEFLMIVLQEIRHDELKINDSLVSSSDTDDWVRFDGNQSVQAFETFIKSL